VPELTLTPTSYLVLGLVAHAQPCTPYDMKRLVGVSIGHFWSFPHSQLYAEPIRLVACGLLTEEIEAAGRRRKLYRITRRGEQELREWLREPAREVGELRELGLLKLFFASLVTADDIVELARAQREAHERELESLRAICETFGGRATPAQVATLDLGLRWNETAAAFWREVERRPPG
jgi:PadR family transcriptional regulator, regulatory protein AphA